MLNRRLNNNNNNNNDGGGGGQPPRQPMEEEQHIEAGDIELVQPMEEEQQPPQDPMEQNDNNNQPDTSSSDSDSDGPIENIIREQIAQQQPIEQEAEIQPIEQEAEIQPIREEPREIYIPQDDLDQIPQQIQEDLPLINEEAEIQPIREEPREIEIIDLAAEDDIETSEEEADIESEEEVPQIEDREEVPQIEDIEEVPQIEDIAVLDDDYNIPIVIEPEEREIREERPLAIMDGPPPKPTYKHGEPIYTEDAKKFEKGAPEELLWMNWDPEEIIWQELLRNNGLNNDDLNNENQLNEEYRDADIENFFQEIEDTIRENEGEIEEQRQYQTEIENLYGQQRENYKRTPQENNPSKRVEVTKIPYATLEKNRQQLEELMERPDEEFTTTAPEPASLTEGGQHFKSKTAEKTKGKVKWYKIKYSDRLLRPLMKREWKYSDDEKHVTERTKINIKSKFKELNRKIDNLQTKIKEQRRLTKKENNLLHQLINLRTEVAKLPESSKSTRMRKLVNKLQYIPTYNVC